MSFDITGTDLRKLAAAAYALSAPQGLGILHYQDGPLDEATLDAVTQPPNYGSCAMHLDYVKGRACKLNVNKGQDGRLTIGDRWFDHSPEQLEQLLASEGVVNNGHVSD
jgi:hypothetical protein